MPDEKDRLEEKDTFKMRLEKRTLFASQQEEASGSLRYPESEESKSEVKETQERTEGLARCSKNVTPIAGRQATTDAVPNGGAAGYNDLRAVMNRPPYRWFFWWK